MFKGAYFIIIVVIVPKFGEGSAFVGLKASVHACNKTKFCKQKNEREYERKY